MPKLSCWKKERIFGPKVSSTVTSKSEKILRRPLPGHLRTNGHRSILASSFFAEPFGEYKATSTFSGLILVFRRRRESTWGDAEFSYWRHCGQNYYQTWRWHRRQLASAHMMHTTDVRDKFWIIWRAFSPFVLVSGGTRRSEDEQKLMLWESRKSDSP